MSEEENEIPYSLFVALGLCGCGDPESAVQFVATLLSLIDERMKSENSSSEASNQLSKILCTEELPGMAWFMFYCLDNLGLTEHGSVASGCWLTDRGKEVLAQCNDWLSKHPQENK